jgi:tripartite ATP-independent transporter DctP family solute receptor
LHPDARNGSSSIILVNFDTEGTMKIRDVLYASLASVMFLAGTPVLAHDFRAADGSGASHPAVLAMKFMGERIFGATQGKYGIKIYANASLGSAKSTVELVKIGAIDMARVSTAEFYGILPELQVPSLPFLFRDAEHFRKTMNGPVGDEILKSYDRTGWIGLCFYETGARSLYAKKPIRAPADTQGLKIRARPSSLWVAIVAALGGIPTPVPGIDAYVALKTDLLDAAESNVLDYETSGHDEAAPVYSETRHVMVPDVVVFSRKVWDTLSREEQLIIHQAAKDSVAYHARRWTEKERASKEHLGEKGVIFIDDVRREEFAAATRSLWDRFAPTPELDALVRKIVDTR